MDAIHSCKNEEFVNFSEISFYVSYLFIWHCLMALTSNIYFFGFYKFAITALMIFLETSEIGDSWSPCISNHIREVQDDVDRVQTNQSSQRYLNLTSEMGKRNAVTYGNEKDEMEYKKDVKEEMHILAERIYTNLSDAYSVPPNLMRIKSTETDKLASNNSPSTIRTRQDKFALILPRPQRSANIWNSM